MSGTDTTKESNSHTSHEAESSHKATPQHKSSSTESREVAAAQKSPSMAKAPVTSAAAVKSTKPTASKLPKVTNFSNYNPNAHHAKVAKWQEQHAAAAAKAVQDAAEKTAKADAKRREAIEERKKGIVQKRHHPDPRFDTSYLNEEDSESDGAAMEPQRNSTAKKGAAEKEQPKKATSKKRGQKNNKVSSVSTSSKKVKSITPKQPELPNADLESVSTERSSTSHNMSSSPVATSAPGDATARSALYAEISDGHYHLAGSQNKKFRKFLNKICKRNFDQDDEVEFDEIPYEALRKLATWIKHH